MLQQTLSAYSPAYLPALQTLLHPNSVYTLPGAWAGGVEWGMFSDGAAAWRPEVRDEAEDRLRGFAEECDSLHGEQSMRLYQTFLYLVRCTESWGTYPWLITE